MTREACDCSPANDCPLLPAEYRFEARDRIVTKQLTIPNTIPYTYPNSTFQPGQILDRVVEQAGGLKPSIILYCTGEDEILEVLMPFNVVIPKTLRFAILPSFPQSFSGINSNVEIIKAEGVATLENNAYVGTFTVMNKSFNVKISIIRFTAPFTKPGSELGDGLWTDLIYQPNLETYNKARQIQSYSKSGIYLDGGKIATIPFIGLKHQPYFETLGYPYLAFFEVFGGLRQAYSIPYFCVLTGDEVTIPATGILGEAKLTAFSSENNRFPIRRPYERTYVANSFTIGTPIEIKQLVVNKKPKYPFLPNIEIPDHKNKASSQAIYGVSGFKNSGDSLSFEIPEPLSKSPNWDVILPKFKFKVITYDFNFYYVYSSDPRTPPTPGYFNPNSADIDLSNTFSTKQSVTGLGMPNCDFCSGSFLTTETDSFTTAVHFVELSVRHNSNFTEQGITIDIMGSVVTTNPVKIFYNFVIPGGGILLKNTSTYRLCRIFRFQGFLTTRNSNNISIRRLGDHLEGKQPFVVVPYVGANTSDFYTYDPLYTGFEFEQVENIANQEFPANLTNLPNGFWRPVPYGNINPITMGISNFEMDDFKIKLNGAFE